MKTTKKLLIFLAALSTAGFACAQEAPAGGSADSSAGTLGRRYGDINVGLQDIKHISDDAYSVGLGANIPVTDTLDATFDFGHAWLNSTVDQMASAISVTGTAYTSYNGMKPFAFAGIGFEWDKVSAGNFINHSQYGIWGLGVGLEIPVALVFPDARGLSLSPTISYSDDFRKTRNSAQAYTYGAEANYWIDSQVGVYGDVGRQDVLRSSFDSWIYTAGVRIRY